MKTCPPKKNFEKSLKKLLTKALKCDMINKLSRKSESERETAKDLEN